MGYYIINFVSNRLTLKEDITIDVQVSKAGKISISTE